MAFLHGAELGIPCRLATYEIATVQKDRGFATKKRFLQELQKYQKPTGDGKDRVYTDTPASHPVLNAAWKLYPPMGPSRSRISPAR